MSEDYGDLLEGISESDIPYEMEIIKTPTNKDVWKSYIDHKTQTMLEETSGGGNTEENFKSILKFRQAILALHYRRLVVFNCETEFWNDFTEYYIKLIQSAMKRISEFDIKQLIHSEIENFLLVQYDLLKTYDSKVAYWKKVLEFIISCSDVLDDTFIIHRFNEIISILDVENHLILWEIFFGEYFNRRDLDASIQFEIYSTFFQYLENCHNYDINVPELAESETLPGFDTVFSKLLQLTRTPEQMKRSETVFSSLSKAQNLLKISESELELYRRYFEKVVEISLEFPKNTSLQSKLTNLLKVVEEKFPDQQGIFRVKFATYSISSGKFNEAVADLEELMQKCVTLKDFALAFDFLSDSLEKRAVELSEKVGENAPQVTEYLDKLENLLSHRRLMINDVKLRQNVNTPSTWAERIDILKEMEPENSKNSRKQVIECYSKALISIKAPKIPKEEKMISPQLWCDYAKVYLDDGDVIKCRTALETATKVPWTDIEQLEEIWINWIKLEIARDDLKHAKVVCSAAVKIPKPIASGRVSIDDDNISVHMKLFKSVRIWSLFLDIVENTSDFDETCQAYEDCIELQVINGVMLINYTLYLEENGFIEKSFSVFERGLTIFSGESKSVIYAIYLTKVLNYWNKLAWNAERVREVYEAGIDYFKSVNEINSLRNVYISYSDWEAKNGSHSRSLRVLEEGISNMNNQLDKMTLYKKLITGTIANRGLEWAVPVFRDALQGLSVQTPNYITEIVGGFVMLELQLGEVAKARNILMYATESIMEFNKNENDRRDVWELYKAFELVNGNEATYKEMLRQKIYLENIFGKVVNAADEHSENAEDKIYENGVGFVPSSTGPKTTTISAAMADPLPEPASAPALPQNEDAIELDMDMDLDMDL